MGVGVEVRQAGSDEIEPIKSDVEISVHLQQTDADRLQKELRLADSIDYSREGLAVGTRDVGDGWN